MYARTWEKINETLSRIPVVDGWLIKDLDTRDICYVPDRFTQWTLTDVVPTQPPPPVDTPPPAQPPVPVDTTPPVTTSPPTTQAGIKPCNTQNVSCDWNGLYTSVPGWQTGLTCLEYSLPNVTYGSVIEIVLMRRSTYEARGNIKTLRCWKDNPGCYPNWYLGSPDGKWIFLYSEKLDVMGGVTRINTPAWSFAGPTWRKERYVIQYPSACGKADGNFKFYIDDILLASCDTWQVDSSTYPGVPNYLCIQDDPSNWIPPADAEVQYATVYVTVK